MREWLYVEVLHFVMIYERGRGEAMVQVLGFMAWRSETFEIRPSYAAHIHLGQ